MIKIAEIFCRDLYILKLSKDSAREEILRYLNKKITLKTTIELLILIIINKVKRAI